MGKPYLREIKVLQSGLKLKYLILKFVHLIGTQKVQSPLNISDSEFKLLLSVSFLIF
jgi:hypothetical protein